MPWLSVRLLRLSLAALVTGAFLGGWRLAGLPTAADWIPRLRSAHVHLMLFGWLLPFVLGVGYWILPRHPGSDQPRGSPRRAHAGAALLAAGIAGGAAGILTGLPVIAIAGRATAVAGVAVFVSLLWPRARGVAIG